MNTIRLMAVKMIVRCIQGMCCSRCDRTTSTLLHGSRLCEAFRKASPPAEKEGSSESRGLACRKQRLFLVFCGSSHVFLFFPPLLFHNEVARRLDRGPC